MKQIIRRLLNRTGVNISRVAASWRGEPVSREVVERFSLADQAIARQVEAYTATSLERVCTLVQAVRYVLRHQVQGAFVECGVWRGGSMMAIALTLLELGVTDRDLFLFDTFEGMSAPTENDRTPDGVLAADLLIGSPQDNRNGLWCYAGLPEVKENLRSTGYPEHRLHFVKGKVEETIPHLILEHAALIRLDTDWYESTLHELTHLYPLLSVGGVLVIDDYGAWQGARQAVDQYISEHPEYPMFLSTIDYTGRLVIKVPSHPWSV
jgi:O-methyltransferase